MKAILDHISIRDRDLSGHECRSSLHAAVMRISNKPTQRGKQVSQVCSWKLGNQKKLIGSKLYTNKVSRRSHVEPRQQFESLDQWWRGTSKIWQGTLKGQDLIL